MGIMENTIEATIYIGIMENKMQTPVSLSWVPKCFIQIS